MGMGGCTGSVRSLDTYSWRNMATGYQRRRRLPVRLESARDRRVLDQRAGTPAPFATCGGRVLPREAEVVERPRDGARPSSSRLHYPPNRYPFEVRAECPPTVCLPSMLAHGASSRNVRPHGEQSKRRALQGPARSATICVLRKL